MNGKVRVNSRLIRAINGNNKPQALNSMPRIWPMTFSLRARQVHAQGEHQRQADAQESLAPEVMLKKFDAQHQEQSAP